MIRINDQYCGYVYHVRNNENNHTEIPMGVIREALRKEINIDIRKKLFDERLFDSRHPKTVVGITITKLYHNDKLKLFDGSFRAMVKGGTECDGWGYAVCKAPDQFNKRLGKTISIGRALKNAKKGQQ